MARTFGARAGGWGGDSVAVEARHAAVRLFAETGFDAVSMRMLSIEIGASTAALYKIWPTKQELLADVVVQFMDELIQGMQTALPSAAQARLDPAAALDSFVRFHIRATVEAPEATRIATHELRALDAENLSRVAHRQDAILARLETVVAMGVEAGVFSVSHIRVETAALMAMLRSVADWYAPDGPLTAEDLEDIHADLALRAVGAA